MKSLGFTRILLGLVLLALISGCASYPISSSLREVARKDVTVSMVSNNPQAYTGSIVIWGGIIIETTNTPTGSQIKVLETPLKGWERPSSSRYSEGRFIAESSQFLDPMVYKKGKKITIAGEITGTQTLTLGKGQYDYPVIKILQLYLWRKQRMYMYEPYYDWYYWPGWPGDELYYGYSGGFHDYQEERHEHGEHDER